jgi:surfeit locus 1 family protein
MRLFGTFFWMLSTERRRATLVFMAALLTVVITARLGWWQVMRAEQKKVLQTALDTRKIMPVLPMLSLAKDPHQALEQHYRRVHLQGEWVVNSTVFLDNRQMRGRPGFFVVTAFKLPSLETVLVQRGWVVRDAGHPNQAPQIDTPSGPIELEGQVAPAPGRLYEFAKVNSGSVRQNIDMPEFSQALGVALLPLSVMQLGASSEGLLREWTAPAIDIQKHHGYAFQWFALCALTIGLYVWFQLIAPGRKLSS